MIPANDRLIVALDLPSVEDAQSMVERLGEEVRFYKIGLELCCAGGLALADALIRAGKRIFLDMKFHDIPNTVERATARVAALGVDLLTIHAYPQTMAAAKRGAVGSGLKLLAVTVLTSCDDADLAAAGYAYGARELVARRAGQAKAARIDGIVLSPEEIAAGRAIVGPGLMLVAPGIRAAGAPEDDQKRIASAAAAIHAGADLLVVGRPITQAADPREAVAALIHEISEATQRYASRPPPESNGAQIGN